MFFFPFFFSSKLPRCEKSYDVLTLTTLTRFSSQQTDVIFLISVFFFLFFFFFFFHRKEDSVKETVCMKCLILFSGEK